MEYSDDCITAMRYVVSKVAVIEDKLYFGLAVDKECTVEMYFPDEWTWHMTHK